MKLNVGALALALGIMWGVGLFAITWWLILFEGASGEVTLIGRVYRGYCISPMGSVIGFVWGFVDGAIGGGILAWVYNWFAGRFNPKTA